MRPYITVGLLWKTATEAIPLPMLGMFDSHTAAQDDGFRSIAQAATGLNPALLSYPVTVTPHALTDEVLRMFLADLAKHRPDLIPAVPKVKRGRR